MGAVNKQMNPQDIQRTLQNFEKESMKMDMSEEMSKNRSFGQFHFFKALFHSSQNQITSPQRVLTSY